MQTINDSYQRGNRQQFAWMMVVALILSFIAPQESSAQWGRTASSIFGINLGSSGGALNFKGGVLWAGHRKVLYSLDTGRTWTVSLATLTNSETVMDIDFIDSVNGLIRTSNYLYITRDRGANWSVQLAPGTSGSRYAAFGGASNIIISCAADGMYRSVDGGNSWVRTFAAGNPNIVASRKNGTIAAYNGNRLVISHDFGATWIIKPTNVALSDSYSIGWDICDSTRIYVANEDYFGHNQNWSEVLTSTDEGTTWTSSIQQALSVFNGGMSVAYDAAFFQTIANGIYRTTDRGITWTVIGGPNNNADTRWLAAITGNIIVGIDQSGNVWRTDNSGGSPIGAPIPVFSTPKTMSISTCERDTTVITIRGISCRLFSLHGANIAGRDTALFHVTSNSAFPDSITAAKTDTFKVTFDPQHHFGTFYDTVHITWHDMLTGIARDTVFPLFVSVTPSPFPCALSNDQLVFDTISACRAGSDSVAVITNRSCDTVSILNPPDPLIQGFSIDKFQLPLILPPDSSVRLAYHFRPKAPGYYDCYSTIRIDGIGGVRQNIVVKLHGQATASGYAGANFDSLLILDTVPSCIPNAETFCKIKNTGCAALTLSQASVMHTAAFTLDSSMLPIVIPTDSTISIRVYFHPPTPGGYNASATLLGNWEGYSFQYINVSLMGTSSRSKVGPLLADTDVRVGVTTMCSPYRDTTISIYNRSCDTLHILSGGTLIGSGFTTNVFKFPTVLSPDSSLILTYHFQPTQPGKYQATTSFVTERGGITENIVLKLSGVVVPTTLGPLVSDQNIDMGPITSCEQSRDTIITLTNHGCDTMKITSLPLGLTNGFSADPYSVPLILLPDSSTRFVFHFRPRILGSFTSSPVIGYEREGTPNSIILYLRGDAGPGKSILSFITPKIVFSPISICKLDSGEISYTNNGCDTLFVTSMGSRGDPDFLISSGVEQAVAREDTLYLKVHFVPNLKGERKSECVLHCRTRSGLQFDTTLMISGFVTDGSAQIFSALNAFDFKTSRLCTAPDTTITIANTGCDTLKIFAAELIGSGFDLGDVIFPIIILPGKDTSLSIFSRLDTVGKKKESSVSLTFRSNSDKPFAPIIFRRGYRYPTDYPLRLETSSAMSSLTSGDTYTIRILADNIPKDLRRIDAALAIEHSDLLTFVSAKSRNNVVVAGDNIILTGGPVVDSDGILAELSYRVYLTKDSTSQIALRSIHFNTDDSDYEHCFSTSLPQSKMLFAYGFNCGDQTLLGYMNGNLTAQIFSLRPIPAKSTITMDLRTLEPEDLEIREIDSKGTIVKREFRHHSAGRGEMVFDVSSLSSGLYSLQLRARGSDIVVPFLIQK